VFLVCGTAIQAKPINVPINTTAQEGEVLYTKLNTGHSKLQRVLQDMFKFLLNSIQSTWGWRSFWQQERLCSGHVYLLDFGGG